ncbi:glycosyltransferase [Fictibacillus sp. b24]|uniref:glycosyltransferase family 2 protein n=1 Tax=Fictibacillus sp. b24 TaxID=3055863 RepID=UPI0025A05078|nr:glycosyltransferase [Fictibacillus sp. b24]MDM5316752.1 glycosyltransferase [Fictibacillus sp. b24]
MSIEVSVIMISYNKYPQNLFSLFALENQTFDLSKMEVIFVDDSSSDETPKLKEYSSEFEFKYIRCDQNVGRSKAKNIGIQASSGSILIFIDAEMILDPEFVEQHYNYHQIEDNFVLTGCLQHYCAYTVIDPNYNTKQRKHVYSLIKKANRKSSKKIKISKSSLKRTHEKVQLFSEEDIKNLQYKDLSFYEPFYPEIINKYGIEYKDFYMPWMFVITHNISLRKNLLKEVGLFFEGFQGYGCEDWELGYRLYKNGAKIIDIPHVHVYHQEHPRGNNDSNEGIKNYYRFFRQHPNFDVGVLCLAWMGKSYIEINDLIGEFEKLISENPKQYINFTKVIVELFNGVFVCLSENKRIANLLSYSKMKNDLNVELMLKEKERLTIEKKAGKLVNTMNYLLNI